MDAPDHYQTTYDSKTKIVVFYSLKECTLIKIPGLIFAKIRNHTLDIKQWLLYKKCYCCQKKTRRTSVMLLYLSLLYMLNMRMLPDKYNVTRWSIEAKLGIFRIYRAILILSFSTAFQNYFGPNPIFIPYSVTKLWICVLSVYSLKCIYLLFTSYFCLDLNFMFGLHVTFTALRYFQSHVIFKIFVPRQLTYDLYILFSSKS